MWLNNNSPHIDHWTEANVGINSLIFLKDGKPAFLHSPPSQDGRLIEITAGQLVWRTVKEVGFTFLHTQNLNQDPLENTFGAILSYCGFNNNPAVGLYIDAQKTSIINGLAYRGLCVTSCEDDGANVLDNLQSFLREPNSASRNPSMSHRKETPDDVSVSLHVAWHVQKDKCSAVHAGDIEVFSVGFVIGSIARQVHTGCASHLKSCCPMSSYISMSSVIQSNLS
jgi:hypothetical protein